jgi:hypothetical protein
VRLEVAKDLSWTEAQRVTTEAEAGQVPALDQIVDSAATEVQEAGDVAHREQAFFQRG